MHSPVFPGFGRGAEGSALKPEVRGIGSGRVICRVRNSPAMVALVPSKSFPLGEIAAAAEVFQ